MSKVIFIFALFLSIVQLAHSATLTPVDPSKNVIEEGKIFETKLLLEESEELSEADFAATDKEQFNEYFFFLEGSKTSEKEFRLRLLLKKFYQTGEITKAKFGSKELDIRLTGYHITSAKELPKDFIIQDQKEGWRRFINTTNLYIVLSILLIFSYPLFRILRKIYLKNKNAKKRALKKEYWQSFFYAAQERGQFEEIGLRRKDWLPLLRELPTEVQTFFNKLDEHQYKKSLEQDELQELKKTLNGMKDVFDRYGI